MLLAENPLLPVLRSDIQLNEAPPEPEGTPTWTLYDPAANKYYKIGWLEFECLSRFGVCKTVRDLAARVRRETPLDPGEDAIKSIITFLLLHNLVLANGDGAIPHFETLRDRAEKSILHRALHGYLFFTIPLFKPQNLLRRLLPVARPFLTRGFMVCVFALLAYGVALSVPRTDEIITTFMQYLNFEGVVFFLCATILIKIFHELGHAFVATKYGVPVTVIGVAFIVLYPVLYTETTNAWRLQSRRDRLYIAGAGLMADITLAAIALVLWHALSPGLLQSLCFMVAIVSLGASLVVNLNPLMKFDGYYLFSDFVGVDNLQDRSFAFAKWRLRRLLWAWDDQPPELLPQDRRNFLIWFGFATWAYRFFLFLGIALVVYHVFFQPLGLILMLVELGFFIAMPVVREVKIWMSRRNDLFDRARGRLVALCAVLIVLFCLIPMRHTMAIPAVLHAAEYTRLYAPIPARIDEILVTRGQDVAAGDVLFRLSSGDLDYNIGIVSQRLRALKEIKGSSQAIPDLAKKRVMIDQEIAQAQSELDGYRKIADRLVVRAPFDGRVVDVDSSLHAGQWVGRNTLLGLVVDPSAPTLSAYVAEHDMRRLSAGASGTFYPEYSPLATYDVAFKDADQATADTLYWAELSSVHGGAVLSEREGPSEIRPLPRYPVYAARFALAGDDSASPADPGFIARGTIRVEGRAQSIAMQLIKKGFSALFGGGNV